MISGRTTLIAHLGYPTESFKAPLIFNPWFAKAGIDAKVVPMGIKTEDYSLFLRSLFRLTNIRGAIVGGLVIGILQSISTAFISSVYGDAVIYGVLFVLLIIWPAGFFRPLIELQHEEI